MNKKIDKSNPILLTDTRGYVNIIYCIGVKNYYIWAYSCI